MKYDHEECLRIICDFPTIYKTGDKSPLGILGQSGYADLFDQITEDKITKYMVDNARLVETWLIFTEDIRHNPAWGLHTSDKSKWTVSFNDSGLLKEQFTFDNQWDACAKMIKMTMEELRKDL